MITHAETGYSCYNPLQIPQHDAQGGPPHAHLHAHRMRTTRAPHAHRMRTGGARIFITCTMVNSFSGNNHKARSALLGSWDAF